MTAERPKARRIKDPARRQALLGDDLRSLATRINESDSRSARAALVRAYRHLSRMSERFPVESGASPSAQESVSPDASLPAPDIEPLLQDLPVPRFSIDAERRRMANDREARASSRLEAMLSGLLQDDAPSHDEDPPTREQIDLIERTAGHQRRIMQRRSTDPDRARLLEKAASANEDAVRSFYGGDTFEEPTRLAEMRSVQGAGAPSDGSRGPKLDPSRIEMGALPSMNQLRAILGGLRRVMATTKGELSAPAIHALVSGLVREGKVKPEAARMGMVSAVDILERTRPEPPSLAKTYSKPALEQLKQGANERYAESDHIARLYRQLNEKTGGGTAVEASSLPRQLDRAILRLVQGPASARFRVARVKNEAKPDFSQIDPALEATALEGYRRMLSRASESVAHEMEAPAAPEEPARRLNLAGLPLLVTNPEHTKQLLAKNRAYLALNSERRRPVDTSYQPRHVMVKGWTKDRARDAALVEHRDLMADPSKLADLVGIYVGKHAMKVNQWGPRKGEESYWGKLPLLPDRKGRVLEAVSGPDSHAILEDERRRLARTGGGWPRSILEAVLKAGRDRGHLLDPSKVALELRSQARDPVLASTGSRMKGWDRPLAKETETRDRVPDDHLEALLETYWRIEKGKIPEGLEQRRSASLEEARRRLSDLQEKLRNVPIADPSDSPSRKAALERTRQDLAVKIASINKAVADISSEGTKAGARGRHLSRIRSDMQNAFAALAAQYREALADPALAKDPARRAERLRDIMRQVTHVLGSSPQKGMDDKWAGFNAYDRHFSRVTRTPSGREYGGSGDQFE